MKFAFPDIGRVFDTDDENINTLIIENQQLFLGLLTDIHTQVSGADGRSVVSDDGKLLRFDKTVDLLTQFVPFELNRKTLLTKVISSLEHRAIGGDCYAQTLDIMGEWERYLFDLSFGMDGDISFGKFDIGSFIKASSPYFEDNGVSLGEKIVNYMELVRAYDRDKLFITCNLRSFLDDRDCELFLDTVIKHGFHLLMIESNEYSHMACENRYVIDCDLCEIC